MIKIRYIINEKQYTDMLEYQIRSRRDSVRERFKYIGSNVLFCALAVYYCFSGAEGLIWKLLVLGMAAALLVMSTWHRYTLRPRAKRAFRLLRESGQIADGYLGTHTLTVDQGRIAVNYGTSGQQISCSDIAAFEPLEGEVALRARDGAIFDIIPENFDGSRSAETLRKLQEEIERETQEIFREKDEAFQRKWEDRAVIHLTGEINPEEFICGQVQGQRYYYTTAKPWIKGAMIRLMILVYGIGLAVTDQSRLLALAFIAAGLLLSRQLLLTFTPAAVMIARKKFEQTSAGMKAGGEIRFVVTSEQIAEYYFHNEQFDALSRIQSVRACRNYQFIYMISGQMFVVPNRLFENDAARKEFRVRLAKGRRQQ